MLTPINHHNSDMKNFTTRLLNVYSLQRTLSFSEKKSILRRVRWFWNFGQLPSTDFFLICRYLQIREIFYLTPYIRGLHCPTIVCSILYFIYFRTRYIPTYYFSVQILIRGTQRIKSTRDWRQTEAL